MREKNKTYANLAVLKLRANKKNHVGLLFLLSLSFFFFQFMVILTDSILATNQNKRFEQYGEWEFAINLPKEYSFDRKITTEGNISTYGTFVQKDKQDNFFFGYYDEEAVRLSKIRLLQGKMPEKKDEIALELEVMYKLGLTYELGQELQVIIFTPDSQDDTSISYIPDKNIRTFRICGILESFSSGWAIGSYTNMELPEFIISKELSLEFSKKPIVNNIKIIKNNSSYSTEEWLNNLRLNLEKDEFEIRQNSFVQNENSYPKLSDSKDEFDQVIRFLLVSAFVVSMCILFLTMNHNIRAQKDTLHLFSLIGVSRSSQYSYFGWQCFYYFIVAFPIGIISALLFSNLAIYLFRILVRDDTILIKITFSGILLRSVLAFITYFVIVFFSFLFQSKFHFIGQEKRQAAVPNKKLKQKKQNGKRHCQRSSLQILLHSFLETPFRSFLFLFFVSIYLTTVMIIFYQAESTYKAYEYQADRPIDFMISSTGVTKEKIEELKNLSSMKEFYSLESVGLLLGFDLEAHHNDLIKENYFRKAKQKFPYMEERLKASGNELYIQAAAISSTSFWNKILSSEYQMTDQEMEEFHKGKTAIIFMPAIFEGEDGSIGIVEYREDDIPLQLSKPATDMVKVSDQVSLIYVNQNSEDKLRETKNIKISKIKSAYYDPNSFFNMLPNGAFELLISDSLLSNYKTYSEKDSTHRIAVTKEDFVTKESTLQSISNVLSGKQVNIVDYDLLKKQAFGAMILELTFLLFLLITLSVVISLIIYYVFILEEENRKEKTKLFFFLGMQENEISQFYLIKGLLSSLFCIFSSILFYFGYAVLKSFVKQTPSCLLSFFNQIRWTNWNLLFVIYLIFLFLFVMINVLFSKKTAKMQV